jgi:hypothetical protein
MTLKVVAATKKNQVPSSGISAGNFKSGYKDNEKRVINSTIEGLR